MLRAVWAVGRQGCMVAEGSWLLQRGACWQACLLVWAAAETLLLLCRTGGSQAVQLCWTGWHRLRCWGLWMASRLELSRSRLAGLTSHQCAGCVWAYRQPAGCQPWVSARPC